MPKAQPKRYISTFTGNTYTRLIPIEHVKVGTDMYFALNLQTGEQWRVPSQNLKREDVSEFI